MFSLDCTLSHLENDWRQLRTYTLHTKLVCVFSPVHKGIPRLTHGGCAFEVFIIVHASRDETKSRRISKNVNFEGWECSLQEIPAMDTDNPNDYICDVIKQKWVRTR